MTVYLDMVMVLNFLVDLLLLLGTNRLAGFPMGLGRCVLAAAYGGVYSGVCLLPRFSFLGNSLWRVVSLGAMALLAFGMNTSALRRGGIFVILSMALGGIALSMGTNDFLPLLGCGIVLLGLCHTFAISRTVILHQYRYCNNFRSSVFNVANSSFTKI